jgi:hypothetical protein
MRTAARAPWRRRLIAVAVSLGLLTGSGTVVTGPAYAYEPVGVVHTEKVTAGPYDLTIGFSVWPIRAMQSLDITFSPEGGITDKEGSLSLVGVGADPDLTGAPLARHPRKLEVWGLDVIALSAPGTYSLDFTIDGEEGRGTGSLPKLTVLAQPGPPLGLSWAVCAVPFLALVALIGVSWGRVRPGRYRLDL